MAIGTDFSITTGTNNIRYTGAAHGATGAGYYTTIAFHRWLQETSQVQQSFGKIISKQPIAEIELVGTHYHANAITAQVQESRGSVKVVQQVVAQITVSVIARTYQQQVSFGKVTTNDDSEMLMVLMALLELDDSIT